MRRASRLAAQQAQQQHPHAYSQPHSAIRRSSTIPTSSSSPSSSTMQQVMGRRSLSSISTPPLPLPKLAPVAIDLPASAQDWQFRETNGIQSYDADATRPVESTTKAATSSPPTSKTTTTNRYPTSGTSAAEQYMAKRNAQVIAGLEASSAPHEPSWTSLPHTDPKMRQAHQKLTTTLYWAKQHALQKKTEENTRQLAKNRQDKVLQFMEPGETGKTGIKEEETFEELNFLTKDGKPKTLFTKSLSSLYPVWHDSLERTIKDEQRLATGDGPWNSQIRLTDGAKGMNKLLQSHRLRLAEVPSDVASVLLLKSISSVIMQAPETGITVVKFADILAKKWIVEGQDNRVNESGIGTEQEGVKDVGDVGDQALNDMTERILNASTVLSGPNETTSDVLHNPSQFVREETMNVMAEMKEGETGDVESWVRGQRHSITNGTPSVDDIRERLETQPLGHVESIQFGAYLLKLVIANTHIPMLTHIGDPRPCAIEQALVHRLIFRPPLKTFGMIVPHEAIRLKLLGLDRPVTHNQFMSTGLMLPTAFPPTPWTGPRDGGFLTIKSPILRRVNGDDKNLLRHAPRVSEFYCALNKLGETPWQVNKFVYGVARDSYDHDYKLGDMMPSHQDDSEWNAGPKPPFGSLEKEHTEVYNKWLADSERCRRNRARWMSKRSELLMKLGGCEKLADYDQFWFPFSADFRGRVYPIPSTVNPIQDDLSRGLITFARARPLGKRGLFWLKVHLANNFGVDKVSFEDREAWVNLHIEDVIDCGVTPIDPKVPTNAKWWTTADKPWEALAAIREIALALESGNPETHMCKLPVHQDGSCNGLQHYAALGRDAFGGGWVNLTNAEKPRDVYTFVAKEVIEKMKVKSGELDPIVFEEYDNDLETTTGSVGKTVTYITHKLEELDETRAKLNASGASKKEMDEFRKEWTEAHLHPAYSHLMKERVTRKLVKQTVMTTVYGVTMKGAIDQISTQMDTVNQDNTKKRTEGLEHDEILSSQMMRNVSVYIAQLTLESIGEVFDSATSIKVWLKEVCDVVTGTGNPMQWVTPMGLPVTQPYIKKAKLEVRTVMQQVVVVDPAKSLGVNKMKQKSAFPPNFVHSLDAVHMMMTAVECHKNGMDFTAVHDSYWTHAGDVEQMNVILRKQFVDLHSQDHLGRLLKDVQDMYPQYEFPPPPKAGQLDLEKVKESRYFFN